MKKKWFKLSNILIALIAVLLLALLLSPAFKGWTIQGLTKAGLSQPALSEKEAPAAASTEVLTKGVSFRDGEENVIDLSAQKGKVIFINFWATWCPPCIEEMPSINKLYSQFKDDKNVLFLMVDMDNDYEKSSAFMKDKGYGLPVYTPASELPKAYFSDSLPTTVILDKNGAISFHHIGGADYSDPAVAAQLKKLSEE